MCVSARTHKTLNLRCWFLKRRLTNTLRRHRLADGQLSSLFPTSPSFSSFDAASVMLCCSAPPARSSTPLRPSVHYPSISLVVNIMHTGIQTFCGRLNVIYIFGPDRLVSFWSQAGALRRECPPRRLSSFPLSLSPPTPSPSRWPALTTLPGVAKIQLVWRRSCEALLSSFSLAGQKHPPLLSRLCLKCRRYTGRLALHMNIKSSILFADTVDALTATSAVWTTTSVEGPIERHKSRLALRETGEGRTGTYSGGSLDRTESVLKWSRERRVRAGLRESPRRDKAVRSWSLNHSLCPKM